MRNQLLIIITVVLCLSACSSQKSADSVSRQMLLGTYSSPPFRSDKHVDIKKLIDQLKDLNANTYNWLIWKQETDWEDLHLFLPEAKKKNIKVWVTLVPPTESKPIARWNSEPFKMDYIRWAAEIAQLSKKYTNLVAWSIDDFAHNLTLYTPDYVKQMMNSAKAINPKLSFIPCLYYRQISAGFAKNYGELIDGILFPYRAESSGKANLQDATLVQTEIQKVRSLFPRPLPVYMDVYSTAHSQLGPSTPAYVRDVIIQSKAYADGVLIYTHPNPVTETEKYNFVRQEFKKR